MVNYLEISSTLIIGFIQDNFGIIFLADAQNAITQKYVKPTQNKSNPMLSVRFIKIKNQVFIFWNYSGARILENIQLFCKFVQISNLKIGMCQCYAFMYAMAMGFGRTIPSFSVHGTNRVGRGKMSTPQFSYLYDGFCQNNFTIRWNKVHTISILDKR